jgi:cob(I)alamin adenosyltransferase
LAALYIVTSKVLRVSSSTSNTSDEFRKRVYTKFGDAGETSLLYGGRVSKNGLNTEAYGITDEAVSAMGLARAMTSNLKVNDLLRQLQRDLFTIAAELATDPDKYELFQQHFKPVTAEMVTSLEETIDSLEEEFEMPKVFILPGGSQASAAIDLARCVIRTAERRVVAMAEADVLTNGLIMAYLNRLGDLLFVLARYEDRDIPIERAT